MFFRRNHLLALVAALGVLLHAGMAAAQVFCAMTGSLSTSCCCPEAEGPDGPAIVDAGESCCRDALPSPSLDLQQPQPQLPRAALAADWAQVVLPDTDAVPEPSETPHPGTSPPLLALGTIVILR